MGSVNITLANGQLGGTLQTNDGITGIVLTGISESGGYTAGTPILVNSLADVTTAGITEADNPFAIKQLKEFYNQAGTGASLYMMLVPDTMTVAQMADNTNANGAKKLLDFAAGKIKVLGLLSDDVAITAAGGTVTVTHGLNGDVYTSASNMAVMSAAYFAAEKPFRAVIGGSSYSGTPSALTDEATGTTNNRTAVLIGDTVTGASACIGLLLGVISAIPVQRKISRVRSGALTNTAAFTGTSTVEAVGAGALATIAGKGFITFTTYPNVSGYFFSGDPMLTATTDDYCMLARGRVIDKVHILAYTTFVQEVDDEVPVNTDGTLDAGFCKWLSQQIVNQVNNTMTANKEISAVSCFIDPAQNILSTNRLNVVLKVLPVGYATEIQIDLGFTNPANQ
ncbi:MAG: hypothetical protein JWQ38_182 [Flavipsychrobacter sp.]|nr:hypothetical protein [Flavipsychrobacter sp.]